MTTSNLRPSSNRLQCLLRFGIRSPDYLRFDSDMFAVVMHKSLLIGQASRHTFSWPLPKTEPFHTSDEEHPIPFQL